MSGVPSTSSAPKSTSTSLRQLIGKRKPPGPPPGPPPPLLSDDEDDEPHYKPKRREKRRIRFNDDSTRDPEEPEKDSRTMYKQQAKMLVAAALQSDQMPAPPAYEECKHCASRSPWFSSSHENNTLPNFGMSQSCRVAGVFIAKI